MRNWRVNALNNLCGYMGKQQLETKMRGEKTKLKRINKGQFAKII